MEWKCGNCHTQTTATSANTTGGTLIADPGAGTGDHGGGDFQINCHPPGTPGATQATSPAGAQKPTVTTLLDQLGDARSALARNDYATAAARLDAFQTTWLDVEGPVTQHALAEHAATDEMMTSQVLRALEERGLVERAQHPSDARARKLLSGRVRPVSTGIEPCHP